MMPLPKVVAMATVAGAVVADALLWTIAQAQQIPINATDAIGGGLTGGIVVGAVAWATYKQKVDALEEKAKQLDERKADKDAVTNLAALLEDVRDDVKWMVRQKGGRE